MLTEEATGSFARDDDLGASAAYRKAKKQGAGKTKNGGPPHRRGGDKVGADG